MPVTLEEPSTTHSVVLFVRLLIALNRKEFMFRLFKQQKKGNFVSKNYFILFSTYNLTYSEQNNLHIIFFNMIKYPSQGRDEQERKIETTVTNNRSEIWDDKTYEEKHGS